MFLNRECVFIILTGTCMVMSLCSAEVPDLVGAWRLDETTGTVAVDSSGNGNDGTLIGDAIWVADGRLKGAVELDGTGDYVDCGAGDPLNLTEQVTLACWLKVRNFDKTWQTIVSKGDNYQLERNSSDSVVNFYMGNPGRRTGPGSTPVNDGEWHHAAGTYDGTAMRLYIDGLLDKEAAITGAIHVDADPLLFGESSQWPNRHFDGWIDDVQVYSRALDEQEINEIMAGLGDKRLASAPDPDHETMDVLRDADLAWESGESAATHNVYFGTVFDDVNQATVNTPMDVLLAEGLARDETTVALDRLAFGQTYYWRVDEVNGAPDHTVFKGEVWSFTSELLAYPIVPVAATASSSHVPDMGPGKTINGSGLDALDQHGTTGTDMWLTSGADTERWIQYAFDKPQKFHEMWVWNSNQAIESLIGFGVKTVTIETSTDAATWTTLADVPEFTQAPGTPGYAHNTVVDFGGVTAQYVKLTINAGWGMLPQFGLSEVRFFTVPVYVSQPQPADGSTADSIEVTLQWRPGREAGTHDVILSSDRTVVEDGSAVIGTTGINSFRPDPLLYGSEYFWRINEVNEAQTPASFMGDVWRLQAPEYLVIDDFEMYADKEFLEIWAFWVDGYEDPTNGSLVGNGNIGEKTIVYHGGQSMPIHYDNSSAPISEVTRTFDPLLDWNKGAPATLSLQVRGDAPAFIDDGDTLTVGGSGADIWNAADEFRFVYKTLSGNGSITAKVESLSYVDTWAKAGVMIREGLTAESTCAYTVATGAEGVTFQYRPVAFANSASDSSTRDAAWADQDDKPVWVRVERIGDEFNGYMSLDGVNWTASASNPQSILMVPEVKIGFCVTSHDNDESSTAVFSNVSTSGDVSGSWMVEEFGEGHPDNDAAPLYLVIRDSSGREKLFSHPDANVSINTNWTPWQIPLNDLGLLNLSNIEKITIGVGEPDGSATGGQGTVFVDLLQVGTPLATAE